MSSSSVNNDLIDKIIRVNVPRTVANYIEGSQIHILFSFNFIIKITSYWLATLDFFPFIISLTIYK